MGGLAAGLGSPALAPPDNPRYAVGSTRVTGQRRAVSRAHARHRVRGLGRSLRHGRVQVGGDPPLR